MKRIWVILLFVLGLLIYLLGFMVDSSIVAMVVSLFGAFLMFPAMVRLGNKLFPDKKAKA